MIKVKTLNSKQKLGSEFGQNHLIEEEINHSIREQTQAP
jgi:hypothetical protein